MPSSAACIALLATLSLVLPAPPARLDTEAAPLPYVAVAEGGRFFFKMSPSPELTNDREAGVGFAYKAGIEQESELLWRTEGWFAFRVFLSTDGRYLVRMGNWPRGIAPSAEHLAVAFYDRGVLLKSYSTLDVIVDKRQVNPSVSHYDYLSGDAPPHLVAGWGSTEFILTTVDRMEYTFDITTGAVLEAERLQ